jgi:hypothetical protein
MWFWAEVIKARPEKTIIQWELNKTPFDSEQALLFENRLLSAISLHSTNAHTHLLLARLYTLHVDNSATSIACTNCVNYVLLAENQYIQSTTLQPTWDYAWAKKAEFYDKVLTNKIELSSLITKLNSSLLKAVYLGPYERATQKTIIPLLFKHWQVTASNDKHKEQILLIFEHSLQYRTNTRLVITEAIAQKMLPIIEPLIKKGIALKILNQYKK